MNVSCGIGVGLLVMTGYVSYLGNPLFLRNRYKSKLSIYRPTGGYCSRRNRIGSNRTNVTKSSVRRELEYTFIALTLNPMGKWRCLEIEAYAAAGSRQKRNGNRTSRLLHSPSRVSVHWAAVSSTVNMAVSGLCFFISISI